jgi:cytidyltransferase-like protein
MKKTTRKKVHPIIKKSSKKDETWVMVSGGFDPIHIGHARMFEKARKLGDKLVVVINNDHWLRSKKGYVFMSEGERKEIIGKFPFVDKVVLTSHKKDDTDRSVSRELAKLKPAIFANGGDRKSTKDVPESKICKELGIKMAFNVGAGGKVQSSSWIIGDASRNFVRSVRPWGEFYGWDAGKEWKLKTLYINPGKRLSLQYHYHRREHWMLVEGDATATIHNATGKPQVIAMKKGEVLYVDVGTIHRLESKKGGIVVEIALGNFDENDIVRVEDDHGRVS